MTTQVEWTREFDEAVLAVLADVRMGLSFKQGLEEMKQIVMMWMSTKDRQ